jgi:hypothetical protein
MNESQMKMGPGLSDPAPFARGTLAALRVLEELFTVETVEVAVAIEV